MINIENWQEEMLAFNPWARNAWKKRWDLATFEAVTFGENVSFDRAIFQGIAAMPKLENGKGPSFNGTRFNGPRPFSIKYDE